MAVSLSLSVPRPLTEEEKAALGATPLGEWLDSCGRDHDGRPRVELLDWAVSMRQLHGLQPYQDGQTFRPRLCPAFT